MWRRSSWCTASECVETAPASGGVLVRDGADPAGPRLRFGPDAWRDYTRRIKAAA